MSNTGQTTNTMQASEADACIKAGRETAAVDARHTEIQGIPVALEQGGAKIVVLEDVLRRADSRAAKPLRIKGSAVFTELESFVAHVLRMKDEHSVIFAHDNTLTAILDYHRPIVGNSSAPEQRDGAARWCQHLAVYTAPLSREWKLWTEVENKFFTQDSFGDLLDLNIGDLSTPSEDDKAAGFGSPSQLASIARSLQITARKFHERKLNPTTGEQTLIFKEEHEESSTKIPSGFLLGIPVYEAGAPYRVECKLRIKVESGVRFGFLMPQREQILRES